MIVTRFEIEPTTGKITVVAGAPGEPGPASLSTCGWPSMRVRLKGINRSVKRPADGTIKTFWYAWRGGPRLQGEPGSPGFIASDNAAVAAKVAPVPGTLRSVLTAYQGSSNFTSLRESTRRDYTRLNARIEKRFASFPLVALTDPRTRGVFVTWRDELSTQSPKQANYTWSVLNVAVSWGLDRGLVPSFTKAGSLYSGTRVDHVWEPEDDERFLARAPERLRLPFLLAIWTGQRQGDLLCLPWSAYDGRDIRLQQSKIPVGGPRKAALDATPRIDPLILTNNGRAAFRHMWLRACKRAGIKGLRFHDLRSTAVRRLANAGCTVPEIVAITRHSLADANTILDAHDLHLDQQLSENAIGKLETRTNLTNRTTNRITRTSSGT